MPIFYTLWNSKPIEGPRTCNFIAKRLTFPRHAVHVLLFLLLGVLVGRTAAHARAGATLVVVIASHRQHQRLLSVCTKPVINIKTFKAPAVHYGQYLSLDSPKHMLCSCMYTHTILHTATHIPTGPVKYPDADRFVQGLYIESMTAPITPNFCRNRLLHIKRCVKKIVIAHVFETCLLQVFEKKRLCITCA